MKSFFNHEENKFYTQIKSLQSSEKPSAKCLHWKKLTLTERSCSGVLFIYRHRSYKLQFNRINKLKSSEAKDANNAGREEGSEEDVRRLERLNNDTERETWGDGGMQVESDCSSSRAAIDCSSWQRRLYQQSERFTAWPIYSCYNYTHRNHTCKHTAGGRREVCNQTYIQRSKQTVERRLTADDNKLNSRRRKTLIHVVCVAPTQCAHNYILPDASHIYRTLDSDWSWLLWVVRNIYCWTKRSNVSWCSGWNCEVPVGSAERF